MSVAKGFYTNSKCPTLKALAELELYLWEQKWHDSSQTETKAYLEWQRVYRKMASLGKSRRYIA